MNSETLNNQCCIMETVFLRNIIMTSVQLLKTLNVVWFCPVKVDPRVTRLRLVVFG